VKIGKEKGENRQLLPFLGHFPSEMFREVLNLAGIGQSMSRKGDCWDNAPCESWFGKMKVEWMYPNGVFATRKEAELSIIEYIEMFHNSKRLHQSLDDQTPNEVEAQYAEALTATAQ